MNEEIKVKIERAASSYEDKRYKNEHDMDYYGVSTCFKAGAEFGIREGFELAIKYFERETTLNVETSALIFFLKQEGIRLGILPGGEGGGEL